MFKKPPTTAQVVSLVVVGFLGALSAVLKGVKDINEKQRIQDIEDRIPFGSRGANK